MRVISSAFFLLTLVSSVLALEESTAVVPAQQTAQTKSSGSFGTEQLEQLVAPIALYPDALLTQVLMAATYPLEVVEAARWVKKNTGLRGDALETALKDQTWDPSVKSLCALPDVLGRMNENLDWTQDLGDAFLAQQGQLMDAVQNMRRKAYEAGNLKSSEQQTVTEQPDKIIVVESTQPEVVYVPTYYPTSVYGPWSYPYWYYPPLYVPPPPGAVLFAFTLGVAWGHGCWGGCHWGWGHTEIDIDVNRYNTFVRNTEIDARRQSVEAKVGSGGGWQHDPAHRKGVGYKDGKVAQKYGAAPGQTRVSREQARGFGDGGASRGGAQSRPTPTARDSGRAPSLNRSTPARPAPRPTPSMGSHAGSFSGSHSPKLDHAGSLRGAASRGSAGARGGFHGGGRRGR